MADDVAVEVAVGRYRLMPLAEALLAGAERAGTKEWPSGAKEPLYRLPRAVKRQRKDDGRRRLGTGFLTQRERKSLENLVGKPIESAQDARREMKARDLHFDEPGTKSWDRAEALRNEMEGGGSDALTQTSSLDLYGDYARMKANPADWADRLAYHTARIARGEPLTL